MIIVEWKIYDILTSKKLKYFHKELILSWEYAPFFDKNHYKVRLINTEELYMADSKAIKIWEDTWKQETHTTDYAIKRIESAKFCCILISEHEERGF